MGPVEFIKSCFVIAWVIISFAVYVKVSFSFVDWLAERIGKRKGIEEHEDEVDSIRYFANDMYLFHVWMYCSEDLLQS